MHLQSTTESTEDPVRKGLILRILEWLFNVLSDGRTTNEDLPGLISDGSDNSTDSSFDDDEQQVSGLFPSYLQWTTKISSLG